MDNPQVEQHTNIDRSLVPLVTESRVQDERDGVLDRDISAEVAAYQLGPDGAVVYLKKEREVLKLLPSPSDLMQLPREAFIKRLNFSLDVSAKQAELAQVEQQISKLAPSDHGKLVIMTNHKLKLLEEIYNRKKITIWEFANASKRVLGCDKVKNDLHSIWGANQKAWSESAFLEGDVRSGTLSTQLKRLQLLFMQYQKLVSQANSMSLHTCDGALTTHAATLSWAEGLFSVGMESFMRMTTVSAGDYKSHHDFMRMIAKLWDILADTSEALVRIDDMLARTIDLVATFEQYM